MTQSGSAVSLQLHGPFLGSVAGNLHLTSSSSMTGTLTYLVDLGTSGVVRVALVLTMAPTATGFGGTGQGEIAWAPNLLDAAVRCNAADHELTFARRS